MDIPQKNTTPHKICTMAKTINNRLPSEGSPSKGRKVSSSIVTPPKKIKKGEFKIAVKSSLEKSVVAVEAAVVVVVTVFFVVVVAGLVVAAVVVFAFRDNGTIVYEPNHTNEEEEERS